MTPRAATKRSAELDGFSGQNNYPFKQQCYNWGLAGIAIVSPLFVIATISPQFDYQLKNLEKPILLLVVLMMAAGAPYLWLIYRFKSFALDRRLMIWIIGLGLLARLSMFASTPILEDDFYRYFWDGGVLANGFNPYKYSPQEVLNNETDDVPEALRHLADSAGDIVTRINYPRMRTIYPTLTQCVFALAHIIRPWSMAAWRLVLLAFDLLTLCLLAAVLRRLRASPMGLVIYWWNPLLIKEVYNSGHMDLVVLPFILGAMLFSIKRRHILASGALGLAVGAKFWPVILLPVVLRPALRDLKSLIAAVGLFASVSLAMFLPFWMGGLNKTSGLVAYGNYWEMNDALFMILLWGVKFTTRLFSLDAGSAQLATRAVVGCLLLAWVLYLTKRDSDEPLEINRRFLFIIAGLFLLSPTQFPWYTLWMLPFIAIQPKTSLLLLTGLLPLYYLRFYFNTRDMAAIHDFGVVWLEFVPVWFLLIREWRSRPGTGHGEEAPVS